MHRHTLRHLEMHIIHTCNLMCKYCAHYCDFGYTGEVPYAQGAEWLRAWGERLAPRTFRILGGEPLLHKDAEKYIRLCAQCFPKATREFVTNGLFLRKREDLFPALIETHTILTISLHPLKSQQQAAALNSALALAYRYMSEGLFLRVDDTTGRWGKSYLGEGAAIMPFSDGDSEQSFQRCGCSYCKTLHQGKLWKCPPLAYLPLIVDQLETKRYWEPYLQYTPLGVDASDAEIAAFIEGDSQFCGMCAATSGRSAVSVPGFIPDIAADLNPIDRHRRSHRSPSA